MRKLLAEQAASDAKRRKREAGRGGTPGGGDSDGELDDEGRELVTVRAAALRTPNKRALILFLLLSLPFLKPGAAARGSHRRRGRAGRGRGGAGRCRCGGAARARFPPLAPTAPPLAARRHRAASAVAPGR